METMKLQNVGFKLLTQAGLTADHGQGGEVNRTSRGSLVDARSFDDLWDYKGAVSPLQSTVAGSGGPGTLISDQRIWERFLLGHGETWLFNASTAALREIGSRSRAISSGTLTTSQTGGPYTGRLILTASNLAVFPSSAQPSIKAWSFRCARNEAAGGWDFYAGFNVGSTSVATASFSKNGAAVATGASIGVDNWLSVSGGGDFTVRGLTEAAGAPAAVDYAEVEPRPFQLNAAIVEAMTAATLESAGLPRYTMSGDAVDVEREVQSFIGQANNFRVNKGIVRGWDINVRQGARLA